MQKRYFAIHHNSIDLTVTASVREQGGPLLLLLHGLGCSRETWRDIWKHEAFRNYSLCAPDFPGFGKSDRPGHGFSYEMEDQALVTADIIKQLSPSSFYIIAHSMGAAVGLLLPPKVLLASAAFVSLEGNLIGDDCSFISRETVSVSFPEFEDELLPRFKKVLQSDDSNHLFLETTSPLGFYKSSRSLVRWSDSGELLNRFNRLRCPRAYVYGEKSNDLPVLDKLGQVEKIKISNSGHFMMNDNPDEFYQKLHSFLETVKASAA